MNESLRFLTGLEKLRKAATNGGDWHLDESHVHGAINCGDKHIAMVNMYVCNDYPTQNVLREQQLANATYIVAACKSVKILSDALLCLASMSVEKDGVKDEDYIADQIAKEIDAAFIMAEQNIIKENK